jgi:multiple sugar transport system substrate-binding protein
MTTLRKKTFFASVALASAATLTLGACASGTTAENSAGTTETVEQNDSGGAITVWVDPPRVPAAEAFAEAYPDIPFEFVQIDGTVGGQSVKENFANFDAAGGGWPDAIFFPSNDDIAWATSSQSNYAADLTDDLADIIAGYDPAVLSFCNFDDRIRCLRNDAAPDVFWYNKAFFDENGYSLPTTWEGYADLAVEIAAAHPGKVSGFLGDAYAINRYLQASDCPTNERVSESEARISPNDDRCVRATELLAKMWDGGALSTQGVFDADAVETAKDLVMTPGAVWYGNYLFIDTWGNPSGQISAVGPLTWEGESSPSTGNEGGGLWAMSSHITGAQKENALTFMKFVATDPRWQVELSTGLPGYGPIQDEWLEGFGENGEFAELDTVKAAFKSAASAVTDYSYMLYDTGNAWSQTVSPRLIAGDSMEDALASFFTELQNRAAAVGYTVLN